MGPLAIMASGPILLMEVPLRQYPRWMYNANGDSVHLHSAEEESMLEGKWADTPGELGIVTAPSVNQETPQIAIDRFNESLEGEEATISDGVLVASKKRGRPKK